MAKTADQAAKSPKFNCPYRQKWHGRRGKPSSEKRSGGRHKRWYEEFFRPDDPEAAGLVKNKLGFAFRRVQRAGRGQCRLAK